MNPRFLSRVFVAAVLAASLPLFAQEPKRPIKHSDYDAWRTIGTPIVSRDGRWLAYSFMPLDADGDVVVRELASGRDQRIPVGTLPPPLITPPDENANPDAPPPPRVVRIAFTSDSKFVVASTYPPKADVLAARKAKKDAPKGGLAMLNLTTGAVARAADVKNFQVPAKGGAWVAYLKEKPEEKKPDAAIEEPKAAGEADPDLDAADQTTTATTAARRPATVGAPAKEYGTDLVLRDLTAGAERVLPNAVDYSFARDGKALLFTVSAKTETENGLYAVTPGDTATPATLAAGKGKYSKLTWNREQTQLAFVTDRDDAAAKLPAFKTYLWARGSAAAAAVVAAETAGPVGNLIPSDKGALAFSRDGKKLYIPAAPPPKPPRAAPADEDKIAADLWRWNDDYVQPMQKVRAALDRNRTYRGEFDLATKRYTQLADPALAQVSLSDDGTRVIGSDDRAYRQNSDFAGRFSDYYFVDPVTGARKLVLKQQRNEGGGQGSPVQWSPDGKWAAFYQDKHWHALNTATGEDLNLTAKVKAGFWNEQDDRPDPPSAYGAGGWTKDSSSFLAYDRFDVWQLFPDGRAAKNLTAGSGAKNKTVLRLQRIEPVEEDDDERGLDPAKPLVLRGESEETRASGFFRTTFAATGAPEKLLWGDKNFRYSGRALEADVLLVTASRFDAYPDVYTTNASFASPAKVTDGAAQQAAFLWGSGELVPFKNADGVALQAALYKPANFDPKKKYPLIVYLYERLSQNVHSFVHPVPMDSINLAHYVSNGYLVLTPDIVYTTGYPGRSALKCVLPALDAVVKQGFVDEKNVGIQGHSWGGFQIAYMVTQTDRFRCAEAGAPVGNMTSAYSGIRWGSGQVRQLQYEHGQSRIGKTLQEAPELYLENSAIFKIEKIHTPLLLMANDADDAVPWYQGIEFFLALRRHDKPAWLFNYNGAFHHVRRRAEQRDYALRMNQFFDHYLKGAPAPEWMEKGIPYLEREEEKERFQKAAADL
jgi:dipeptidyl aminopeptidase/acylaminoacyl peptidase